jgi:hypothetical protein
MTLSRTITGRVKLAPADRGSSRFEVRPNDQPQWFEISEVERHARFVGYFNGKDQL